MEGGNITDEALETLFTVGIGLGLGSGLDAIYENIRDIVEW
jgi:hypothetical protein